MKFRSLTLKNFRRFSELSIDFHPELTIIVARNGQGKTSILDAGAIALGTFVGAFDHGKAKHIVRSDARQLRRPDALDSAQQFPVRIEASFVVEDGSPIHISRELTGLKNKTTIKDALALTRLGDSLQAAVRDVMNDNETDLPVIAYYGTGRLWTAHKNMGRKSVLSESRTMGYEDCLSSSSNFKQLQQWMAKAESSRLQDNELPGGGQQANLTSRIIAVQKVVNQVIEPEGWTGFRYSLALEELAMRNGGTGELPVSLFSDGVRAMVSLTADLAWRCARLNGHFGERAPEKTKGIVFIDEVDQHLHPAWQQRVVNALRHAFPLVQFIISTHSPQVLTTVAAENIRVLELDEEEATAHMPSFSPLAHESGDALAKVMGTHREPDLPLQEQVRKFEQEVRAGNEKLSSVKALHTEIEATGYQFLENDLATWRFLASRPKQSKG